MHGTSTDLSSLSPLIRLINLKDTIISTAASFPYHIAVYQLIQITATRVCHVSYIIDWNKFKFWRLVLLLWRICFLISCKLQNCNKMQHYDYSFIYNYLSNFRNVLKRWIGVIFKRIFSCLTRGKSPQPLQETHVAESEPIWGEWVVGW